MTRVSQGYPAVPPPDAPVDGPFYSCACGCGEDMTYPPDMLRWWTGQVRDDDGQVVTVATPGFWSTESCMDDLLYGFEIGAADAFQGPTLAEWLAQTSSAGAPCGATAE